MNTDFPRIMTLIRKEKKLSQKQAAADLGVSQALLSHYEKGIRECGLEFLIRAADYYGVSCDYLLGRSPSPAGYGIGSDSEGQSIEEKEQRITDSEKIIFSLCSDNDLSTNITGYLNTVIYKLLRIIYNANPENDQNAFKISDNESEYLSESLIQRECAEIKKKSGQNRIRITVSELSENFPNSHSLLSVIKSTEDKLNKMQKL